MLKLFFAATTVAIAAELDRGPGAIVVSSDLVGMVRTDMALTGSNPPTRFAVISTRGGKGISA